MKTISLQALFTIFLVSVGLFQNAQAVVPAPDGGYPEGNTAEGQAALFSLKEHRMVIELKKEVAELAAIVKEQAAQIRKVSTRLEMSESAPQLVQSQ
jgi:hypothetical protein